MICRRLTAALSPLFLASTLALAGCDSDPAGDDEETGETGGEPGTVTLALEVDPEPICGEFGGELMLAARRIDCWDPNLPCTLPQNPPWVEGTVVDCSTVAPGAIRWEVEIKQTGRWQARIQGTELACFGVDGQSPTNVANADLDAGAELTLTAAPAGTCGEP